MKIAVTYENGQVFQHFGHTKNFKIYEVEEGKILNEEIISTEGSGHGALAVLLAKENVDVLICGGIGGGAQKALEEAGIDFYGGVNQAADQAVADLLKGQLKYDPDVECNHHHHGDKNDPHGHHNCGENKHGCGGH